MTPKSELAERLRVRLAKSPNSSGPRRSDYDLNPGMKRTVACGGALTDAAVLVPIIKRATELQVLLTQRTEDLPTHAGQISFPGGKRQVGDKGLLETALRETREEVGIEPRYVTVVGYLDNYETRTGFSILPVVGLVSDQMELILDPREVASAFEVPLTFLMDPTNHQRHAYEQNGVTRYFYAMSYEDRYIWGATAGMLKMLYDRLFGP